MKLILTFSLVLLITAIDGFFWGPTGHRIVDEIAGRNLTHMTKKTVRVNSGSKAIAKANTWPYFFRENKPGKTPNLDYRYSYFFIKRSNEVCTRQVFV